VTDQITANKVRPLKLNDLGIVPQETLSGIDLTDEAVDLVNEANSAPPIEKLPDGHDLLDKAMAALDMGYAGVILAGC